MLPLSSVSGIVCVGFCHGGRSRHGKTEPINAMGDHADIRGLVTMLLVSVGRLPEGGTSV